MYSKKLNSKKTTYFLFLIVSSFILGCKDPKEKINLENIQKGQELFTSVGCATCHSLSGDKLYGPALNNILGSKTEVIRNGIEHSFLIDRSYIKKSIIDPDYEKPIFYKSNKMPKPNLTDLEVDYITDYLININNNVIQQPKNEVKTENKSLKNITKKFMPTAIGNTFKEPPQISNLAVDDINQDGLLDIAVCDIKNNTISIISQHPKDTFTEKIVADNIKAPAHVQVFDFDNDGDKDLIVAVLGMLFPNNDRIGSIVVLENDGKNNFSKRIIIENIARVADVRAGDIDGDGDIDLAAAQFGYDDGETCWIENLGNWTFKNHSLQNLSGPINVELIDIDFDNDLDIISLVTQEWEKIYCYENDGKGNFKSKQLWGASNDDFGSSGISISDINKDGKSDIIYTNGDAFDYLPPLPRPWHGIQWLENLGNLKFKYHPIINFPGAFSARTTDIDKDNDEDIFVVSGFNYWEKPTAESLIWLENKGNNTFKKHTLAKSPTHLITLELGDFNNDGHMDMVTGGVYIYPPYDKLERVTLWMNTGE